MKLALIQQPCTPSVEDNRLRLAAAIADVADRGAQLVVLQELHNTPYFCQTESVDNFDLAEPIPGPSTEYFGALARKHELVIVTSLFERRAAGLYHNTAVVLERDGSIAGIHRKMHIPDDPAYYEKFYFTPGDLGYKAFKTKFATVGVLICWDQWYPEAARITALRGAEILFYPTAIGWAIDQDEATNDEQYQAWQTIQRSHAVANGVPVVSVNRTGREGDMQFWGGSFVTNAFGRVLWQAPHLDECLHVQELDLSESDKYRRHWPYLRDRRIDSYAPITRRYLDEE